MAETNKYLTSRLWRGSPLAADRLASLLFYLSILFFIIGFNFSDNRAGGWTQQFMPYPAGGQIRDLHFVDSLLGFAVSDSSILKTINGGDNWSIKHSGYYLFQRINFLNQNTGFACAGNNQLLKTTNSGENWTSTVLPDIFPYDMAVLNEDTIWLVTTNPLTGGVFRTINGGTSWEHQLNLGSQNPSKIYFFNGNIGFIAKNVGSAYIRKTTNSGINWDTIVNGEGFIDMYFADVQTGWKSYGNMKETIDGGLSWVTQTLPTGGLISNFSEMKNFSNISNDTIWGGGGYLNYGSGRNRGILYYTTNGGIVWRFQLPDTSFGIPEYEFVNFTNKLVGWGYESFYSQQVSGIITSGIHTITGGNDTFYTSVNQISTNVPNDFKLFQNYPNPFNPITQINYELSREVGTGEITNYVKLTVYDITGKEIALLVNQKQNAGSYRVTYDGSNLSSGIYFYRIQITNEKGGVIYVETKKAILIK